MLKIKQPPTDICQQSSSHRKRAPKVKLNDRFSCLRENAENCNSENINLAQCVSSSKPLEQQKETGKISQTVKKLPKVQKEEVSQILEPQEKKNEDPVNFSLIFNQMGEYFMSIYSPGQIFFREEESTQITEFLTNCFAMKSKQRNLLVTGKPGCGKTLTVSKIIENFMKIQEDSLFIKINAMAYKNVQYLFDVIGSHIQEKKSPKSKENLSETLRGQKKFKNIVLMIDEIDSLFGKSASGDQELLEIFQISNDLNSKLCLIGISNSMELLYKIGKKNNTNLEDIRNVVFKSYTFAQMMKIVEERIENFMLSNNLTKRIEIKQILEANALRLCANRIFNLKGGDIRCILEVLMKALQKKYENYTNSQTKEIQAITLSDLLNVLQEIFNERKTEEIIGSLPILQQTMLLAFYQNFRATPESNEIDMMRSLSAFNNLAFDFGIPQHNVTNYSQGLKVLESYNFIEIKQGSKLKNAKTAENPIIKMQIHIGDIKQALAENESFQRYFEI